MRGYFLMFLLGWIAAACLTGCKSAERRWNDKGVKKGWLDTTQKEKNNFEVPADSNAGNKILDSTGEDIKKTVKDDTGTDLPDSTVVKIKWKIRDRIIKEYLPAVYPDTTFKTESGTMVRIWFDNGKLKVSEEHKKQVINCPPYEVSLSEKIGYVSVGTLLGLILMFMILVLWRRK